MEKMTRIYSQEEIDNIRKDTWNAARGVLAPYKLEGDPKLLLCHLDTGLRLIFNDFQHYLNSLEE